MQRHLYSSARGYTLIELIMVLVVISVLSSTVLVKLSAAGKRSVGDQADLLRRDIGHIQSIALRNGVALRLKMSAGGYTVTCLTAGLGCSAVGSPVTDPATAQPYSVLLASGLTMVARDGTGATANATDFDSAGRPTAGGVPIATNPARTFTLSSPSANVTSNDPVETSTVILRPITGFVEVSY